MTISEPNYLCQLKKKKRKHNLKVENYILLADKTEDLSPGRSLSDSSEGLLWRSKRGTRIHREEFWPQRPGSRNIKRLLLIKENQTSQVNEFSAFLCMGRCKSLGSLILFLWYTPSLSRASILLFSSWIPSGCTVGGSCSGCWFDGCHILCLLIRQAVFFIHMIIQQ